MAILSKGQTFADADSVTSSKLNNLVDAATFVAGASGSTDDTSLEVNSGGRLQIKDLGVTSAKLAANSVVTSKLPNSTSATDGVTYAKIQQVASMKVLGNTSGSAAAPAEVSILDEDTMVSDSAVAIPTQQSVKAYVDTVGAHKYSGATVFTGSMPTSFADLDLSATIGARRCFVHLQVSPDAAVNIAFRPNGESLDIGIGSFSVPTGTSGASNIGGASATMFISLITDANGIVEWKSSAAGAGASTVKVMCYNVLT